MKHDYIKDKDIIDKYLMHQLSDAEESEFEEHVLFCEECQKEIETRRRLMNIVKNASSQLSNDATKENKHREKRIRLYIRIAASVLILISLSMVGIYIIDSLKENKIVKKPIQKDSVFHISEDTINVITDDHIKSNEELIAEAYKVLPEFENYIKNPVRSAEINILSPGIENEFLRKEKIPVIWESGKYDSLVMTVFDNKANMIFEKKVSQKDTLIIKLFSGLYYWQLETESESLFTGKFFIK